MKNSQANLTTSVVEFNVLLSTYKKESNQMSDDNIGIHIGDDTEDVENVDMTEDSEFWDLSYDDDTIAKISTEVLKLCKAGDIITAANILVQFSLDCSMNEFRSDIESIEKSELLRSPGSRASLLFAIAKSARSKMEDICLVTTVGAMAITQTEEPGGGTGLTAFNPDQESN